MKKRASGILLHITSLPSKYGIGDLGPQAYRFVDFLVEARQSYWQTLPLNPPTHVKNPSPYNCLSAFAGNTLLISPELLYRQGLLNRNDIQNTPPFAEGGVEFHSVISYKARLLNTAFENFRNTPADSNYEAFCLDNDVWLEDYTKFVALKKHFDFSSWCDWPAEIRDKRNGAIESLNQQLQDVIEREKFLQYIFFKQCFSLKDYCNQHDIQIIGDIPIYVAYESADVWAHPGIFKLTEAKRPIAVSGVPPDLFSRTGQLWGNPIYNWQVLKKRDYSWWIQRIKHNLALFDVVRLDHFRGFIAYWEVPANHKTAVGGKWMDGPKQDFFNILFKHRPFPPIIVEDLGYITAEVREFIEKFQLPCMKVLLFAFGGAPLNNPYLPHSYRRNSVVYTGTHDNNTIKGWFEKEAKPQQKEELFNYVGHKSPISQIHWELIRLAMSSVANTVIIPMQDVLGLGQEARMNRPATVKGNWRWRLEPGQITSSIKRRLAKMTETYARV